LPYCDRCSRGVEALCTKRSVLSEALEKSLY